MIVADASFAGSWLLPDKASETTVKILKKILAAKEELAVPDLWSYEMLNLLLTAQKRRRIHEEELAEGIRILQALPCIFYDHRTLLAKNRTVALARRFRLSAYDACYLELADRLQCNLLSLDNALSKAAKVLGLQ